MLDYFYFLKRRKRPAADKIMRLDVLCRTLAGNPCHLLTITNNVELDAPLAEDIRFFRETAEPPQPTAKAPLHRKKGSNTVMNTNGKDGG